MLESDKKLIYKKRFILGMGIILIIFFFSFLFFYRHIFVGDEVVEQASYEHPSGLISRLASLRLGGADATYVNEEMSQIYNDVIQDSDKQYTYQYSVGKKYLSIVTMINEIEEGNIGPMPVFETYVFDRKTKKLLSNQELFHRFSTTITDLATSLDHKMASYYEEEIKSGYLEESCDYSCFLERRKMDDIEEDIHLYVEKDQLKFYRGFMPFSVDKEEDFYRNETFLFDIER